MYNYNPYQGMGAAGGGASGPGYGQNWAYGQQGSNNPYQNMYQGSRNYQQSYQNPYQTPQPQYQPQQPGYPQRNQYLSPTSGGKGRGYGGFGPGVGMGQQGGGRMQRQRDVASDPYRGNDPFQVYGDLMRQRQMEGSLGMDPGQAWNMPQGIPFYELQNMWKGLYPSGGQNGGY